MFGGFQTAFKTFTEAALFNGRIMNKLCLFTDCF